VVQGAHGQKLRAAGVPLVQAVVVERLKCCISAVVCQCCVAVSGSTVGPMLGLGHAGATCEACSSSVGSIGSNRGVSSSSRSVSGHESCTAPAVSKNDAPSQPVAAAC
jgi:hypothetical protein